MLTFSFFITIFATVIWCIYMGIYISFHLNGLAFNNIEPVDLALYAISVFIPLLALWSFWGHFCRLQINKDRRKQCALLSAQISQEHEYSEMILRVLLKNGQQQIHALAISKIELYISEMNEILYDVINHNRLLDPDKLQTVWKTVSLGNRWGFAKVIINLHNQQNLVSRLTADAQAHQLSAGNITEFCARYTRLLGLLKEHDEENLLQDIIETGAFGKVFSIFAPIVRDLHRSSEQQHTDLSSNSAHQSVHQPTLQTTTGSTPWWKRLFGSHEENESAKSKRLDPLALAFERSFGEPTVQEPVLNNPDPLPSPETAHTESTFAPLQDDNVEPIHSDILEVLAAADSDSTDLTADKETTDTISQPLTPTVNDSEEPVLPAETEAILALEPDLPDHDRHNTIESLLDNLPDLPASLLVPPADEEKATVTGNKFAFTSTDNTLKNLQKEWEEMKNKNQSSEPKND